MIEDINQLSARRDRFRLWGKILLLFALALFFAAIAGGYESSTGTLLNSRASYLAVVLEIPIREHRYIWGGPSTLMALQMLTYCISGIGVIRIIWMRLRHRRWSPLGFLLWLSPPLIGFTAAADILKPLYPVTLDNAATDKLFGAVDERQPNLIAELRRGVRPDHLDTVVEPRSTISAVGKHHYEVLGKAQLFWDRGTVEGLRFALAQRATAAGDKAALIRLLPLELPRTDADMAARNAFARRLEMMEQLAGRSAVREADRPDLLLRVAAWHRMLDIFAAIRPFVQAAFVLGLISSLIGWRFSRRLNRLEKAQATLSTTSHRMPKQRFNFGRRVASL